MIARTWTGTATAAKAEDYVRHFTTAVAPNLSAISGSRGAWLLRREADGQVEFMAVSLWDSIEAIKAFAGDDPDVAHIEPEGRAALSTFDTFARNYEIVVDSVGAALVEA